MNRRIEGNLDPLLHHALDGGCVGDGVNGPSDLSDEAGSDHTYRLLTGR